MPLRDNAIANALTGDRVTRRGGDHATIRQHHHGDAGHQRDSTQHPMVGVKSCSAPPSSEPHGWDVVPPRLVNGKNARAGMG
jgi:hypothetical protein